jgi:hypothetical protein
VECGRQLVRRPPNDFLRLLGAASAGFSRSVERPRANLQAQSQTGTMPSLTNELEAPMAYFIFSRTKDSTAYKADRTAENLIAAQEVARELCREIGPEQGATVDILNSDAETLTRWAVNLSGKWVRS